MTTSIGTTDLPAGLTHRRPTLADAEAILALTIACDVAAGEASDATLTEVSSELAGSGVDLERGGRLVLDAAGTVVGWLWTETTEPASEVFVDLYSVDPAILTWLLGRAREYVELVAGEWGRPVTMAAGSFQHDEVYGAILRSAGLEVVRSFWQMRVVLEEHHAMPPPLPPGVTIRLFDGDDNAELRLLKRLHDESFADHWHHTPMSFDDWYERLDASAGVDRTQWWVAHVNGAPAGLLLGAESQAELGEGSVDILGVLREYRGRGVAKALLAEAFAESARRGRTRVGLGVDSESPTGATRLYESMGMFVEKVILAWQGEVPVPVSGA